ncbi:MAG: hypothetical protein IPM26_08875 [Saprospiraceae bacterium]|nr:hypothetical protein [Saprospiraceae bacterium]
MSANKLPEVAPEDAHNQLITYLWVRRGIGILGILFPFIMYGGNALLFGCTDLLPSISAYYHTKLLSIFVSLMSMVAIFLFTYKGPEEQDRHWATLASFLCLGVAIFPTDPLVSSCKGFVTWSCHTLHLICAVALFLVLTYFCLFLFVKTKPAKNPTDQHKILKQRRNLVYRTCGYVMLTSMAIMALFYLLSKYAGVNVGFPYIFWGEAVCLVAFGTAWITKGNWFIFSDLHLGGEE